MTGEWHERSTRSEAHVFSVPAKNAVVDINFEFKDQLGVVEGSSSELIRLISSEEERGVLLGVETRHNRAANVDHTFVIDKQGLRWDDVDVKSVGLTETEGDGPPRIFPWERIAKHGRRLAGVWGGNDLDSARRAFRYQRILEDLGVRTYKSLFVTRLEEWFYKGKKVPIETIPVVAEETVVSGENDALPEGYTLAVEVRACRTKTRMQFVNERSIGNETDRLEIRKEVDRAIALVCEESDPHALSVEDYLDWFVATHGRNVGIMHAAGLVHDSLHAGNVTLDCRILDLDSVQTFEEAYAEDNNAEYGIVTSAERSKMNHVIGDTKTENLATFVLKVCAAYGIPMRSSVSKKFMDAYEQALRHVPEAQKTIAFARMAQK